MYKITLLLFFIVLTGIFSSCGKSATTKRTVNFDEVSWIFDVPDGLYIKDSAFDVNGRVVKAFKKYVFPETLDLFNIRTNSNSRLLVSLLRDSLDYDQWLVKHAQDNCWYTGMMRQFKTEAVIDTSYTGVLIDNVPFRREYLKEFSSKRNDTVYRYVYDAKFKFSQLNIVIFVADKADEQKLFQLLNSSRFVIKTNGR